MRTSNNIANVLSPQCPIAEHGETLWKLFQLVFLKFHFSEIFITSRATPALDVSSGVSTQAAPTQSEARSSKHREILPSAGHVYTLEQNKC